MSKESAGARRRVVSGEESGFWAGEGGTATAQEDGLESRACSNVASAPMLAELLEVVDGALRALDADEIDIARARLLALAETVRATCHAANEHGV